MSNRPRISVIIPTFNEATRIARAVESAKKADATEVIVADGGSNDGTRQLAEQAGALVVPSEKGRAVQQNAGINVAASSDVYLFLHADNWLGPNCLDEIRSVWTDNEPLAGAFRQRINADGISFRCLEFGNGLRARFLRQPYGDQGIFISADLFREMGGFPEVPLMEELYLMRRVRKAVRPLLLSGPVHVDARRWQKNGVVRQTLRNWSLVLRYFCGVAPERLAEAYAEHREVSQRVETGQFHDETCDAAST